MPMHPSATTNETVATLADLQSLRREIHEELSGLRGDMGSFQKEITYQLSRRSETDWTTVLTGFSIALIMAGMAATLVWSLIQAESTARVAADATLVERQQEINQRQDENIAEDRAKLVEQDVVMQREMRLLDEVLQREMGLNVARLENLIEVNTKDIGALKLFKDQLDRRLDDRTKDESDYRLRMVEKIGENQS